MSEQFDLKAITTDGIEAAIARAEHYRLLNQPIEKRKASAWTSPPSIRTASAPFEC